MKKGSKVKVTEEYSALSEENVLRTLLASIKLDKGCIGTIVDEGQQFDWIVSFDLAPKIRIEVDMQEYNLKEIKKHSST